MSQMTEIMITGVTENNIEVLHFINAIIKHDDRCSGGKLKDVSVYCGGTKAMGNIYAGAFNYLDTDNFLKKIKQAPFTDNDLDFVQIFIRKDSCVDEDNLFIAYRLKDLAKGE